MTLRDLSPGDTFTLLSGELEYEYGYRLRNDIAVSCRILYRARVRDLIALDTEVVLVQKRTDRRNPSADAGAECDPLVAKEQA